MTCPRPSERPSRPIETPDAWPETTTWKASNSFFAAASVALTGALAGAVVDGRIFIEAGATQTCAAEAVPAARATATASAIEENFFIDAAPWLAAFRNDRCFLVSVGQRSGLVSSSTAVQEIRALSCV